ncbi:hypothetical protein D0T84_20150 [Dysgonomonas sp. 521]|uniref:hypothetical protein n=1 Tax=Dysgonomonas sp. 521 TaxID=2302932 RepID=UPI0013D0377C|nr:hypothetical protein [Dysgonomonas sp. 521]NDV97196.1 hypothetical protein [Dysgonomonas sp. 521]
MESKLIDGINVLRGLFSGEQEFIDHVIHNILFFDKAMVRDQALDIRQQVRLGKAIPVRYNSNGSFFLQHKVKTTTPSFKNKSEAIRFTNDEENALFHRETKIRVCFDRDGNYYPKQAISKYTQHKVSSGSLSTVVNYTIAHIWSKTDNPLYFSLLWNYCLIPCHCTFLTDKRDDSHPIVKQVKDLIKAICIELYNPNRIMDWNQDVLAEEEKPSTEALKAARVLIKENRISFLPINANITKDINID